MQSKFSKKFNHNPLANDYDENIKNENNPIRRGYVDMMKWVKEKTLSSNIIIDLGCGTGNTADQLNNYHKIYCVDISENMLKLAKNKLKNKKNIQFLKKDLLEFFDNSKNNKRVDTIVSTYAIHHLTQAEKHLLFKKAFDLLPNNGKIVFGDLMFKDRDYEKQMKEKYPDLVEDFKEEFYWYIEEEIKRLVEIGFHVQLEQFSDLSWGIYGEK